MALKNGDRITGEIKKLERGKLRVKTDSQGTVEIEWEDVGSVSSRYLFEVELKSGEKHFGPLEPDPAGKLRVSDRALDYSAVVLMTPLERSIWDRIEGSMDVGFSFTQANESTQWSLNAEASYRAANYLSRVTASSIFSSQEAVDSTSRNVLGLEVSRFLGKRWFTGWFAEGEQNEELDLELRSLVGAGLGRRVVQTNRTVLALLGGATYTREKFQGSDPPQNNAEARGSVHFQFFAFDEPEADVSLDFLILPSLSDFGRTRLELDSKLRIEVFKNLFWSLNLFESYDSAPPSQTRTRNDFGISTAFGWSF